MKSTGLEASKTVEMCREVERSRNCEPFQEGRGRSKIRGCDEKTNMVKDDEVILSSRSDYAKDPRLGRRSTTEDGVEDWVYQRDERNERWRPK